MHWLVLLGVLAGCWDANEDDCDQATYALYVDQPDEIWLDHMEADTYALSRIATAVDGSERFDAVIADECGQRGPASTFTARVGEPFTVAIDGDGVVVQPHGEGSATLHVTSASGLSWKGTIAARPIASVHLAAHEFGVPDAFLAGAQLATIVLLDAEGQPLFDGGMTVIGDVPGGATPNELAPASAGVGDHPLQILAGGSTWRTTLRIVDGIDEVVPRAASITNPSYDGAEVCFFARRAGQVVAGVPWQFGYPQYQGETLGRANCVTVWGDAGTSFTVTAEALGKHAATLVTFTK